MITGRVWDRATSSSDAGSWFTAKPYARARWLLRPACSAISYAAVVVPSACRITLQTVVARADGGYLTGCMPLPVEDRDTIAIAIAIADVLM